jgi:ABC-2 type transport system permease protein
MNSLSIARHAFKVGWYEFRNNYGWPSWIFGSFLGSVTQVVFFAMLGNLLDSRERVEFLLVGSAIIAGCTRANVVVAVSSWDRWDGTYPLLVISPSSLLPAIIGRTAIWMLDGVAQALLSLLMAGLIFRLYLPLPESLLLIPLILIVTASSYFLGTTIGSVVARIPRTRNIVHRIETLALTLFCGATVPVSFWPASIQLLANVLPVTHGLKAIRTLLDGGPTNEIALGMGLEILVGFGWLSLGALVIDRVANGGRRDGSIEIAS